MMRVSVALFAKPPLPGRTKSRLATAIGADAAAGFAQAALTQNLAVIAASGLEPSLWHPPDAADGFGTLAKDLSVLAQRGDDLGERMAHALDQALTDGNDAALVIGADCVTHTATSLQQAAACLRGHDAVLQPAADGGFVLIGVRRPLGTLLDGLAWGHADALAQVLGQLRKASWTHALLPKTHDVDVADDLPVARDWVLQHAADGPVAAWFREVAP